MPKPSGPKIQYKPIAITGLTFIVFLAFLAACGIPDLPERTPTPQPQPTYAIAGDPGVIMRIIGPSDSAEPGMFIAYDSSLTANSNAQAAGSHLQMAWDQFEDATRGVYSWSALDTKLAGLGPGKEAVVRVDVRCQTDNSEGSYNDACAPEWVELYEPVTVTPPGGCAWSPTDMEYLNYLNPVVKQGLIDFISAFGNRYRGDSRIAVVDIGVGYNGEPSPYPGGSTPCDASEQETEYKATSGYSESNWAQYHKDIIDAYVAAFAGSDTTLVTELGAVYGEGYRDEVVKHAVESGVGLSLTSLQADYFANRGSGGGVCYWGYATEAGFTYDSANADDAYVTQYVPLVNNWEGVVIGYEMNNTHDTSGRGLSDAQYAWWSVLNGLDKRTDYALMYSRNVTTTAAIDFLNEYAGDTSTMTEDVWVFLHSPWTTGAWCPDLYDYSFYLTSELEHLDYYTDANAQATVEAIDSATGLLTVSTGHWRDPYARQVTSAHPFMHFDVDDSYHYNDSTGSAYIKVTYLDSGTDSFAVRYDGTGGTTLAGVVNKTDSGVWASAWYTVTDQLFANGITKQYAGADQDFDIRLDRYDSGDDVFSSIVVKTDIGSTPQTPTPTSTAATNTPTNTPTHTPTPTNTWTPTPGPSPTDTPTGTATHTPTPGDTPTPVTATPTPGTSGMVISEVVAGNEDANVNGVIEAQPDQCFEIFNASSALINIDGWTVWNNDQQLYEYGWDLVAEDWFVIFGRDNDPSTWEWQPGTIQLRNQHGAVMDSIAYTGDSLLGGTMARAYNGGAWENREWPTCGFDNEWPTPSDFTPNATWTPRATYTPTPTATGTSTPTSTWTPTPHSGATETHTPTWTPPPGGTAGPTQTHTHTPTHTPTLATTPTPLPTAGPSPTPALCGAPTPVSTPSSWTWTTTNDSAPTGDWDGSIETNGSLCDDVPPAGGQYQTLTLDSGAHKTERYLCAGAGGWREYEYFSLEADYHKVFVEAKVDSYPPEDVIPPISTRRIKIFEINVPVVTPLYGDHDDYFWITHGYVDHTGNFKCTFDESGGVAFSTGSYHDVVYELYLDDTYGYEYAWVDGSLACEFHGDTLHWFDYYDGGSYPLQDDEWAHTQSTQFDYRTTGSSWYDDTKHLLATVEYTPTPCATSTPTP